MRTSASDHQVQVWDPLVRFFHWGLVAAVLVSLITEGKPRWLHVWSGYFIAGLIVVRVVWGFIGPRYARFTDFVRTPGEILSHLRDVAAFRSKPYLGHDPAGGAMIIALLVFLSMTVLSGLMLYGAKDHQGPFAKVGIAALTEAVSFDQPAFAKRGSDDDREERQHKNPGNLSGESKDEELFEEVHEAFATIIIILACLHVGGVLAVSLQTRENLVMSMVTGKKNPPTDSDK